MASSFHVRLFCISFVTLDTQACLAQYHPHRCHPSRLSHPSHPSLLIALRRFPPGPQSNSLHPKGDPKVHILHGELLEGSSRTDEAQSVSCNTRLEPKPDRTLRHRKCTEATTGTTYSILKQSILKQSMWGTLGVVSNGSVAASYGSLVAISWRSRGDLMAISWRSHGNLGAVLW